MIIGSQVFIRKYHHPIAEPNHKLVQIETITYNATDVYEKTYLVLRDNNITERLFLDRMVLNPQEKFSTEEEEQQTIK